MCDGPGTLEQVLLTEVEYSWPDSGRRVRIGHMHFAGSGKRQRTAAAESPFVEAGAGGHFSTRSENSSSHGRHVATSRGFWAIYTLLSFNSISVSNKIAATGYHEFEARLPLMSIRAMTSLNVCW